MKRGIDKISYMLVLVAMIMFMGARIVPHHHCGADFGAQQHAMHIGFDDCECCGHEHQDSDNGHTHSGAHCFSDSQFFLRLYDDHQFVVKKTFNLQPAMLLPELPLCFPKQCVIAWCQYDTEPPVQRYYTFGALRAPPVA